MNKNNFLQRAFFLRTVPHEYLLGILNKMKLTTRNLKEKFLKSFGSEIENPKARIKKLAHYKLVEFFIKADILTEEKEKELYFEFRDSYNPVFYLYKYKKAPFNQSAKLKELIQKSIENVQLNERCSFISKINIITSEIEFENKFKDFIIKNVSVIDNKILEYRFEFLERLDYLTPKYKPDHVYSFKFGLFWLDIINNLVIIKCQEYRIVEAIIEFLEGLFNTYFWKFNLQKNLVDRIFDFSEIIKISYKSRKEIDTSKLDLINIIDREAADKLKDPIYQFLMDYERKMGSYFTNIEGLRKKIRINVSEVGKISLKGGSIKLEKCRDWLINLLIDLMKIQEEYILSKNFESYIYSHDYIKRTELYNYINNKEARQKLMELVIKIINLKEKPHLESVEFHFPASIAYYFRSYITPLADPRCFKGECNTPLICQTEDCDSIEFDVKKKTGKNEFCLKCVDCKTEITMEIELECLEHHKQTFNLNNNLSYIFTLDFKVKLNEILDVLNIPSKINNDREVFYINQNKIYRVENDNKIIYNWEELPSFKEIPKLKDLHPTVKKAQAMHITQYFEKCSNYKGKCRNCEVFNDEEEICISRIFVELAGGQVHPHSGFEFGDFEILQQFSDRTETLYGIVKSYKKTPIKTQELIFDIPFGKLTFKNNDRLLEQFIEACMNASIRFIMIVSGRIIDSKLQNIIIELARLKRKRITIIEPKDLIPILAYYSKNYKTT